MALENPIENVLLNFIREMLTYIIWVHLCEQRLLLISSILSQNWWCRNKKNPQLGTTICDDIKLHVHWIKAIWWCDNLQRWIPSLNGARLTLFWRSPVPSEISSKAFLFYYWTDHYRKKENIFIYQKLSLRINHVLEYTEMFSIFLLHNSLQ
jgi:hypothetical protein